MVGGELVVVDELRVDARRLLLRLAAHAFDSKFNRRLLLRRRRLGDLLLSTQEEQNMIVPSVLW